MTLPSMPTILIVDDEPDTVRMFTLALVSEVRVLPAYDGPSGLLLARTEFPDLVLLDWQMPGMSGIELCRTLREDQDPRLSEVPIVMLTGHSGAEARQEGLAAGVTDFLTKGLAPAQLRSRVRMWLNRSAAPWPPPHGVVD